MLHSEFSSHPVVNPVADDQQESLITNSASASDSYVYNFGVREDSEYGAVWPQLDENLTPEEALRSKFCRVNWFISALVPGILNMCIGFGLNHSYAHMGLINEGDPTYDSPTGSSAFVDMGITSFMVVFLTSLCSKKPVQKGISQAKVGPVNDLELSTGIYRLFPLRVKNHCGRCFLLAIQFVILWFGATVLILYSMCEGGAFLGPERNLEHCFIKMTPYILIKSIWAGCLAAVIYPLAFLPAVNRANLSAEQYQEYLKNRQDILASNNELPHDWPSVDKSTRQGKIPDNRGYQQIDSENNGQWNYQPPRVSE